MNKFTYKIHKFFNGRYGVDDLYKFLLIVCLIIIIVNMFIGSIGLRILELLIFILAIYRVFSKNKKRRILENNKYLEVKNDIFNYFNYIKRRYSDRNTHIYKKCPKCKQKIRLPLKKGVHTVLCPKCKERFEVKCNRNEKIKVEVVK